MRIAGSMLNYPPDQLHIYRDSDDRACCAACECFSCVYLMDILCTVPTMRAIEEGENRYSLLNLPFYEACWPCMRVALACGVSKETLREKSAAFKLGAACDIFGCFKDDKDSHTNDPY